MFVLALALDSWIIYVAGASGKIHPFQVHIVLQAPEQM
jgi:hypothetical protein